MSKKIIAIALFAIMVLSLVPFASAAANYSLGTVTPIGSNTNANNSKVTYKFPAGNATQLDTQQTGDGIIVVTAPYSDIKTDAANDWSTSKVAKIQFNLKFNGTDGDLEVYSSVSGKLTNFALDNNNEYVHNFIATQGGNTEIINIRCKTTTTEYNYTFTIKYVDKDSAPKTVQDLFVKVHNMKTAGQDGLYNAYVMGGVLFIDYDDAKVIGTMDLGMSFYSDADGTVRVPAKSAKGVVITDTDYTTIGVDKFFNASTGTSVLNSDNYKATVNVGVTSFKIRIETENNFHQTASIPVVWTKVPSNQITNVTITPSRNVTIAIGEEVEFKIVPTHATTLRDIKLTDTAASRYVYISGTKVKGIAEGTTTLTVYSGLRAIDAITVTVVKEKTPEVTDNNQYRVIARKLNVRAGAGTGFAVVGSYAQNQIVAVVSIENGWAKLSDGTFVSAQYIVKVESTTTVGNHQVTASSLNVRAAANGSKIGSLKKGTTVNVIEITNGWAKIAYGSGYGYVSATYLKAL